MKRAKNSGIKLNNEDAALVKGMLHRGDRQHDIASWFGVNSGRIAEISVRRTFSDVLMRRSGLPPVGPYLTGKQLFQVKAEILEQKDRLIKIVKSNPDNADNKHIISIIEEIQNILDKM